MAETPPDLETFVARKEAESDANATRHILERFAKKIGLNLLEKIEDCTQFNRQFARVLGISVSCCHIYTGILLEDLLWSPTHLEIWEYWQDLLDAYPDGSHALFFNTRGRGSWVVHNLHGAEHAGRAIVVNLKNSRNSFTAQPLSDFCGFVRTFLVIGG